MRLCLDPTSSTLPKRSQLPAIAGVPKGAGSLFPYTPLIFIVIPGNILLTASSGMGFDMYVQSSFRVQKNEDIYRDISQVSIDHQGSRLFYNGVCLPNISAQSLAIHLVRSLATARGRVLHEHLLPLPTHSGSKGLTCLVMQVELAACRTHLRYFDRA